MPNTIKKRFFKIASRIIIPLVRKLGNFCILYSYDWPFGYEPLASKNEYIRLAKKASMATYPEIDKYEQETGFSIDLKWLHELALHTQVVIKESKICYSHGRVLYSSLSKYLYERERLSPSDRLTIWETGTARGFSALCMAKALKDQNYPGTILTFDVIPHNKQMFWNCIDDLEKPKSRAELLQPWKSLVQEFILFHQGDTFLELRKVKAERIHFAFLDGGHSYEDVKFEFNQIQKYQHPGDIIVYDDYTPQQFPGIVKAVDEICEGFNYLREDLKAHDGRGYVVAVKK